MSTGCPIIMLQVKKDNPEAKLGDIAKIIGAKWGELNEKDKAPYQKKAEADKVCQRSARSPQIVLQQGCLLRGLVSLTSGTAALAGGKVASACVRLSCTVPLLLDRTMGGPCSCSRAPSQLPLSRGVVVKWILSHAPCRPATRRRCPSTRPARSKQAASCPPSAAALFPF